MEGLASSAASSGAASGAASTAGAAGAAGTASTAAQAGQAAQALGGAAESGKGGWLGTGLFGNDQFNPNPSSYAPTVGSAQPQFSHPAGSTVPLALQMLQSLPVTKQY